MRSDGPLYRPLYALYHDLLDDDYRKINKKA
jgi:hypothetical protein